MGPDVPTGTTRTGQRRDKGPQTGEQPATATPPVTSRRTRLSRHPSTDIPYMLNNIKHLNLPQDAIDLYLDAWRPKTRRSYFVYLRKWQTLCIQKNWNKLRPTVNQVIYFLTSLFRSGLSYGSVNLARSALSSSLPYLDGKAVGQHPVICKILKGMYNRRPQHSRYSSTWDVDVVLEYIREMSPLSILPLRELTRKMVMLMLLTSCQRVQTLNTLNVSDLIWSDGGKTESSDSQVCSNIHAGAH